MQRKRLKRWLLGVLIPMVLLVAAGLTLPWWLPKEWVRERIEQELSVQMGREVVLDSFALTHEGFELCGLTIRTRQPLAGNSLITVARIAGPYEPINLLCGRLSRLRIEQPELNLVIDQEGRLNIADLPQRLDLKKDPLELGTMIISQATVHLHGLDSSKTLALDIPHIGWTGGEKTLNWRLEAQLRGYEDAAVTCSGRTLTPDGGEHHWLQIEFSAENLPLQTLHLHDLLNPHLSALGGEHAIRLLPPTGRGTLAGTFSLDTTGVFRFDTRLALDRFHVTVENNTPASAPGILLSAPNIVLASKGSYDLTTTAIDIEEAQFRGPGLELDFAVAYNPIAPQQDAHYHLRRGYIKFDPLLAASPMLAEWDGFDKLGLACSGEMLMTANLDLGARQSHMDLHLDADAADFTFIGGDKPRDKKLSLTAAADYQADIAALRINELDLQWASLHLDGSLFVPDIYSLQKPLVVDSFQDLTRAIFTRPDLQAALHLQIDNYDDLADDIPFLSQPLPGVLFHGPLEASLAVEANERRALLDIILPQQANLQLENLNDPNGSMLISKPVGRAWDIRLRTLVDEQGDPADVFLTTTYGDAQFEAAPLDLREIWTMAADSPRHLQWPWRITRLQDWLTLSPQLTKELEQAGVQLTGAAEGKLQLTLKPDKALQLEGDIHLADAKLEVKGNIQTVPPAEAGVVPLTHRIYHVDSMIRLDDLAALNHLLPRLMDADGVVSLPAAKLDILRGPAQFEAVYHRNHTGAKVSVAADVEEAGFQLRRADDGVIMWGKQPQQRCRLQAEAFLNAPDNFDKLLVAPLAVGSGAQAWRINLEKAHLQVEQSELTLTGKAAFEPPVVGYTFEPRHYRRCDLKLDACINTQDAWLRRVLQLVETPLDSNMVGLARLDGHFVFDCKQGFDLNANADLTETTWRVNSNVALESHLTPLEKPLNAPCRLAMHLSAGPDARNLKLETVQLELDGNRFTGSGDVQLAKSWDEWETFDDPNVIAAVRLNTDIEAPHIENIANWLPELSKNQLAGSVILRLPLEITLTPEIELTPQPAFIRTDLHGVYHDNPFTLLLHAPELSRERVRLPVCRLTFAQNDISLVADVQAIPTDNPANIIPVFEGNVQVLVDTLDIDDVLKRLNIDPALSVSPKVSESQQDIVMQILQSLRHCRLQLFADVGRLKMTDPVTLAWLDLAEIRTNASFAEQSLTGRFTASLNGGVTTGTLQSDLSVDDPVFVIHTENRNLRVDENILPVIEAQFPGMEVSGTVTEITDKQATLSCLLDAYCYLAGSGTTLLTEGVLYGPGGPEWMLNVFPGLKLVEYPYSRMTNRFERTPDGTQKNDIRFRGQNYDIFMEGTSAPVTDPDEYARAIAALETDFRALLERLEVMDRSGSSLSAEKVRRLRYDLEGLDKLFRSHRNGRRLPVQSAEYVVGALVRFGPDEPGKPARELIRTPLFTTRGFIIGRNMVGISTANAPLVEIPKQTPLWRHFQASP
ncbi:MAG: hypothetical protein JW709_12880 [Sedimentisphaerales bacterium]|nr:hypothetical protein [Sedimentisphaerales bacterium]